MLRSKTRRAGALSGDSAKGKAMRSPLSRLLPWREATAATAPPPLPGLLGDLGKPRARLRWEGSVRCAWSGRAFPPRVCVLTSSSQKASQLGSGPTHKASFHLNHLFRDPPPPKQSLLRSWGAGQSSESPAAGWASDLTS